MIDGMDGMPQREDSELVVGTGKHDPWSREFGEATAADLLAGWFELWETDPDHPPNPVDNGRFLRDAKPRVRVPGTAPATHRILLDWRAEEFLLGLSGLIMDADRIHRRIGDDGVVETAIAVRMVAATTAQITAGAMLAPIRSADEQKSMVDLLLAAGVANGPIGPDSMLLVSAPTPWSPAAMREVATGGGRDVEVDPCIEAILPRALSVSVETDPSDGEGPIIRIDAFSSTANRNEQPGVVEAMRVLRRGWTHG